MSPQRARELMLDDVAGLEGVGGTILGTSNRGNPFDYPVEGTEERGDFSEACLETFRRLGLQALIVVGGDGTLDIAHRFHRLGMPIVGVPKTIDNDIVGTNSTFGFDTAVSCATEAIDRLRTTAQAHSRIMVVEVMGRHAGWIALYAGVAGGADVILIPEIPFDLERAAEAIRRREEQGPRIEHRGRRRRRRSARGLRGASGTGDRGASRPAWGDRGQGRNRASVAHGQRGASRRPRTPAAGWRADELRSCTSDTVRRESVRARTAQGIRRDGRETDPRIWSRSLSRISSGRRSPFRSTWIWSTRPAG